MEARTKLKRMENSLRKMRAELLGMSLDGDEFSTHMQGRLYDTVKLLTPVITSLDECQLYHNQDPNRPHK